MFTINLCLSVVCTSVPKIPWWEQGREWNLSQILILPEEKSYVDFFIIEPDREMGPSTLFNILLIGSMQWECFLIFSIKKKKQEKFDLCGTVEK